MYVHRRNAGNRESGLRRATQSRIEAAAEQIRNYEAESGTQFGAITRQHAGIHHARQPEGTAFTLPTDNTFRQAEQLDMRRQELEERDAAAVDAEPTIRTFRIKLNGTWVDVPVDIVSLRLALGLPRHDIFSQGIFHEYQHNPAAGPDVADTDHGAVAAAPPPPDVPLEQ